MDVMLIILSGFITIFSIGLFLVSFFSYRRNKNNKLLFVTIVFVIFLIKGIVLSLGLFIEDVGIFENSTILGLFDLSVLLLLFVATLRR